MIDGIENTLKQQTSAWIKYPLYVTLYAVCGAVLVVSYLWAAAHWPSDKAGQTVIATPAKEVAKVERVEVPVKVITVYKTTPALKKKIGLPQPIVDDAKESILASSKIPAGERAHTVTTVLNTETGKSETYTRTDPLPFLAYESRGEVGAYYGFKQGQPVTRLQIRHDFIQAKALHVGVIGSIDSDRASFIGFGVSYKY